MADAGKAREPKAAPVLPGMSLSWGARFSPQVLVVLLTFAAAVPPLKGAIVSGVHWWWDRTYAQVEYVMDEARTNDGSPYIAGHVAGSTEQRNLVGLLQGT